MIYIKMCLLRSEIPIITTLARMMSFGRKHLYISTLSFSVARTSSFLSCPLNGSANTIFFTHKIAHLAQRGFIWVILAVKIITINTKTNMEH